ncbi:uncharacterized protein LOC136078251 [Hydra vulgaris]|uniref:Uncharacterized protein LOC136078251 n=1 Tax=Hydra vulgaris TaxID=6087 RepID=A0ABM4BKP3_HYDVU
MKNRIITELFIALLAFIICGAEKKYIKNSLVDFHLTSVNSKKISKRNSDCIKLTKDELMSQYKSWSDYDSQYLAATIEEAVLFPNLLWNDKDKNKYMFIINNLNKMFKKVSNHNDPHSVLKFKNLVEMSLNLSISTSTGVTTGNITRAYEKIVKKENFIERKNQNDGYTLEYLCRQRSTTTIWKDRFPPYVNEVECIWDNQKEKVSTCFSNEGDCLQNTLKLKFLVKSKYCERLTLNGITVYVEKWKKISENIKTSCECRLKSDSYLMTYLKKKQV